MQEVWFLEQRTKIFKKVILVWGKCAFDNLISHKTNPLLKYKYNIPVLFPNSTSDILHVSIFNTNESKIPVATLQTFGGDPVLIINLENMHYETIMNAILTNKRNYIWGVNLPFWAHQFITLSETCLTGLEELSSNETPSSIFKTLDQLTKNTNTCYSCFKQVTEEKDYNIICGHLHCKSCDYLCCYHPSHLLEPELAKTTTNYNPFIFSD